MEHHSSYSAPRSSRTAGSPNNRRGRSAKRNTYNTQSWKDNPILKNLVFYVLPFVIINLLLFTLITASPRIALTVGETTDYRTVDISFKVKSILPIREMTVTLESQPLEMEHSDGAYRASLDSNGTLDIYVKSWNGMTARHNEHIAVLDDAPPSIDQENYVLEEGHLEFLVTDSQSGVDYSSIYGTTPDGQNLRPTSTDQGTGRVTFEMEGSELTVFVSDYAVNVSQAAFAIHTNGIDTENRELDFGDEEEGSSRSSAGTQSREASKASETTKAKETTKAAESTKAKETTKAAESTKAKETTKAAESTKAKETTKAAESTKATETTKAAESTKATETTKAAESTKARESTKAAESAKASESTKASEPAQTGEASGTAESSASSPRESTAPSSQAAPGESSSQSTQAAPSESGSSDPVTIIPLG